MKISSVAVPDALARPLTREHGRPLGSPQNHGWPQRSSRCCLTSVYMRTDPHTDPDRNRTCAVAAFPQGCVSTSPPGLGLLVGGLAASGGRPLPYCMGWRRMRQVILTMAVASSGWPHERQDGARAGLAGEGAPVLRGDVGGRFERRGEARPDRRRDRHDQFDPGPDGRRAGRRAPGATRTGPGPS